MRKTLLVVIMALLFLVSNSIPSFAYENEIRILSASMADNISKAGKKRIAVVDFTDLQGNITELGRFIAEELSVDLTMTARGFEMIDRNHLNRILAEHKLSLSGIVDQKTVQKLGQIAGVDAIITGSITPLERSVRVVCKVIATDTARVISAAKGDIAKTKAIEELFGKGIETKALGQTIASTSKAQPKAISRVAMNGLTFEAKGCKAKPDRSVVCHVTVINNEEKEIILRVGAAGQYRGGPSLLYDNLGYQYVAEEIKLGTQVNKWEADDVDVPPQLPVNIFFKFIDVRSEAESVSLRLACNINNDKVRFYPILRNIPLSR